MQVSGVAVGEVRLCVCVLQSGTTHLLYFRVAGRLSTIDGLDVSRLRPRLQRVQLIKSQLPDPAFPPDTKTIVVHVDNVSAADRISPTE